MIAVSVLSATVFSSLSGLPARMLAIRSVCSCTYGLTCFSGFCHVQAFAPVMTLAAFDAPLVPRKCSATLFWVPLICRHMLITR
jgi:hypothetical protein